MDVDSDISLVDIKIIMYPPDKRNAAQDELINTVETFPKTLIQGNVNKKKIHNLNEIL